MIIIYYVLTFKCPTFSSHLGLKDTRPFIRASCLASSETRRLKLSPDGALIIRRRLGPMCTFHAGGVQRKAGFGYDTKAYLVCRPPTLVSGCVCV